MDELLLDTTYLLPIFGIGEGLKGFEDAFPRLLDSYSVAYNPISLLEAKWVALRLARRGQASEDALLAAYRTGLRALEGERRLTQTKLTNDAVEEIADGLLRRERVEDYFDRLIYGTAAVRRCLLLTEDRDLHRVAAKDRAGAGPRRLATWTGILKSLQ